MHLSDSMLGSDSRYVDNLVTPVFARYYRPDLSTASGYLHTHDMILKSLDSVCDSTSCGSADLSEHNGQ